MDVRPARRLASTLTLAALLGASILAGPTLSATAAPSRGAASVAPPSTPSVTLADTNLQTKAAAIRVTITAAGAHPGFTDAQTSLLFDLNGDGVWRPVQTYDEQTDLFGAFTLADYAAGAESFAAADLVAGQTYQVRVIERGVLGGVSYDSAPTATQGPLLARGALDLTYEISTTVVGETITFSWDLRKALNGNPPKIFYQTSTGIDRYWDGPGDGSVGSLSLTVGYETSAYLVLLQVFDSQALGWEAAAVTGPQPPRMLTSTPAAGIVGTAKIGSVLTARPGTWQPAPVDLAYQWNRDGVPVTGATNRMYTVTQADAGARLTVSITGSKTGFAPATVTSAPTPQVPGALLSGTVPTIIGSATFGQTLTADAGTWGPGGVGLTYRWLRNGTPITGATSPRYGIVAADIGSSLTVAVTGTKSPYSPLSLTSAPTATVAALSLTATPSPTISGKPAVGSTLTAKPGAWAPAPVKLTYQWLRGGIPIAGATSAAYRPTAADAGVNITVAVTGSRTGYSSATTVSPPVVP